MPIVTTSNEQKKGSLMDFCGKKIFQHTFTETINENAEEIKLKFNDTLRGKHIVGLSMRRASATRRSKLGNRLANDAVLDASFLTIVTNENDKVVIETPLEYLAEAQKWNEVFPIGADNLNLEQSTILIKNISAINTTTPEDFAITAFYYK